MSGGRIEAKFASLATQKRKGLIPYIMAGDPDLSATAELLAALAENGADLIELGIPFSDPTADGPAIQASALRSLAQGTRLAYILEIVKQFRARDNVTPVILMGYYNPVYRYGVSRFCEDAAKAGVDGMILVDLPPEEEAEFVDVAREYDLKLIRLIAPTTDAQRLAMLNEHAGGFLYYISVTGITGTKSADKHAVAARVKELKAASRLPVAVGFGIRTPRQAAEMAAFGDAVVVGSALVEVLHHEGISGALGLVASIRAALDAV